MSLQLHIRVASVLLVDEWHFVGASHREISYKYASSKQQLLLRYNDGKVEKFDNAGGFSQWRHSVSEIEMGR